MFVVEITQKAISELEEYWHMYPQEKYASRVGLFLGKSYIGLKRYKVAKNIFMETIQRYPESLEAHKCYYKLAMLDILSSKPGDARNKLNTLISESNGPLRPEAQAFSDYLGVHDKLP